MPALSLQEQLFARFPELSPRGGAADGALALNAPASILVELANTLRDQFGFSVLADIAGCDWGTDATPRFGAIYHFQRPPNPAAALLETSPAPSPANVTPRLTLRIAVNAPDNATPTLPSLSQLYASALWYEREAYDLLGILFTNHPALTRLLLPADFPSHPLRKDHPQGN